MGVVRVMNLQRTSEEAEAVDQVSWAEVEILVKEGGTNLNKTFRECNLALKGLIVAPFGG